MGTLIQISNKTLQPFFFEASRGDWFTPLQNLVQRSNRPTLQKVLDEAESELSHLGFAYPQTQNAFTQMYLNRIRTLTKRALHAAH